METLAIPQKDKGYAITFTVTDSEGDTIDLTPYTVTFKAWTQGSPATLLTATACALTDPTHGVCTLTLPDVFTTAKEYYGELELTATGIIISTQAFKVVVTESA